MHLLCVLVLARAAGGARTGARASGPIATTDGPGAEEIFTRPATCPRLVGASKHTSLIFIRTHKTGSSTLQSIIHGLVGNANHTLIKAGAHLKLVA